MSIEAVGVSTKGTYTVQVEGVRSTGGGGSSREGELDGRVGRERVDAAGGEEVLGRVGTRDDLQQDRDSRGNEGGAVDEKV